MKIPESAPQPQDQPTSLRRAYAEPTLTPLGTAESAQATQQNGSF